MSEDKKHVHTEETVDTQKEKLEELSRTIEIESKEFSKGDNVPAEELKPFAKQGKFQKRAFKDDGFETRLIEVKRVIKVTKGGRRFRFYALVVVGDKNGRVGFASSKHIEIPNAISKAERLAKKNLFRVKFVGDHKTISHDVTMKHGAAKILLKPAPDGKGIVASNNVRAVVELAGYKNIYSKNLGTSNPKNVVIATVNALISQRSKEEIMRLRGK